jgi:ribonuclease HI
VKNKDLWILLDEAAQKHEIAWNWVKGHSGNYGNEQADKLATQAILDN